MLLVENDWKCHCGAKQAPGTARKAQRHVGYSKEMGYASEPWIDLGEAKTLDDGQ